MNKLICSIEECAGDLKPKDNGKTPVGLFECQKCKSLFRMVLVCNNFERKQNKEPVPLKPKKVKTP